MFAAAAAIFTLRIRWIVVIGTIAALAGAGVNAWLFWQAEDGESTEWLTYPGTGSVRGYAFDVFVNGTHPLLPWFAFMCAGIVLGRLLAHDWWRPAAISTGVVLYTVATLARSFATSPFQRTVLSTASSAGSLVYVASALGTALLAYSGIDWVAERFPRATDPLRRAGQMTLTIYLAHVFVFNVVVDWLGWIDPAGLDVALVFALGFWTVAILAAAAWQRRFGIGPAERFYRAFSG
jgi:fucose 4-O-acetylase-like acetyltransferase